MRETAVGPAPGAPPSGRALTLPPQAPAAPPRGDGAEPRAKGTGQPRPGTQALRPAPLSRSRRRPRAGVSGGGREAPRPPCQGAVARAGPAGAAGPLSAARGSAAPPYLAAQRPGARPCAAAGSVCQAAGSRCAGGAGEGKARRLWRRVRRGGRLLRARLCPEGQDAWRGRCRVSAGLEGEQGAGGGRTRIWVPSV